MKTWRIVGINFDHMHMGDLLRHVVEHPEAEVVGVWHHAADKPLEVLDRLKLDRSLFVADFDACMKQARADAAIVCASTGTHAPWTEKVAAYGVDVLVEKPFADTLASADRMIAAVEGRGRKLAINWPLAWYPPHRMTKRLIDEGLIGDVLNVHYYDGNKGPVRHKMDKIDVTGAELLREKQTSWFYKKDQAGGSLQDYLGYGVTLATWFNGGRTPIEVTAMVDRPQGLEVDEHSVTVARYAEGLSKFETRWGTFTDPWVMQPQPKCGFVVCGTKGTISSYDYEDHIRVQTEARPEGYDLPVDELTAPHTDGVTYFLHCLKHNLPIDGPLSPRIARIGQQIVDSAALSASQRRTVALVH